MDDVGARRNERIERILPGDDRHIDCLLRREYVLLDGGPDVLALGTVLGFLQAPTHERTPRGPCVPLGQLGQLGHAASEVVPLFDERSHVEAEVELDRHTPPWGVGAPEVERLRHVGNVKEPVGNDDGAAHAVVHSHRLLPEVPGPSSVLQREHPADRARELTRRPAVGHSSSSRRMLEVRCISPVFPLPFHSTPCTVSMLTSETMRP